MGTMSISRIDGAGFISKHAFDEACEAMERLGLEPHQATITIKLAREVIHLNIHAAFVQCYPMPQVLAQSMRPFDFNPVQSHICLDMLSSKV